MLDHIGRIGIFMIAAQALVHFAPGRQYEKYIKSVAGVIILVLFIQPVLQLFGAQPESFPDIWERFEELTDVPDMTVAEYGMDAVAAARMEEVVKGRLNSELEGEEYYVESVSLRLGQGRGQEAVLSSVEVRLAKRDEENGERRIRIGEIVSGSGQPSSREVSSAYRERFAKLLGIEKVRVEVRLNGGSEKAF